MPSPIALDDLPTTWFHGRIAFVAAGGPFCDGFLLGIIAVALPSATDDLGLSSVWQGLIGASALIGMFFGGLIFGLLTDRLGRSACIGSICWYLSSARFSQFFAAEAWHARAPPDHGHRTRRRLPNRHRAGHRVLAASHGGPALGGLVLVLWVGYALSFVVGYLLNDLGAGAWRWMLAAPPCPPIVPAVALWHTGVTALADQRRPDRPGSRNRAQAPRPAGRFDASSPKPAPCQSERGSACRASRNCSSAAMVRCCSSAACSGHARLPRRSPSRRSSPSSSHH